MASYRIVPLLYAFLLLSGTICVINAAPSELVVSSDDAALTGTDAPSDITTAVEIAQTTTEEVLVETTTIALPVSVEDGTEGSGEGSETTTTPTEVTEEPTTIITLPAEVAENSTTITTLPAEVAENPTTTSAPATSAESTTVVAVETTTSVIASTEPERTSTTTTTTSTSTTTSTPTTQQPETTEATTEEPQPVFVCPGAGKFEDPQNCKRYYSCAINVLTPGVYQQQALDCPQLSAYSAEHGRCTRDLASCTDDGFSCSAIGKFADPTGADESFYYWCLATLRGGFHKYQVRCASGERFQPILGGCWRDDWTIGSGWGVGEGIGLESTDIAAIKVEMKQFKAEEKLKLKAAKEQQKLLLKQQKALEKQAKKAAKEAAKQAAKLAEAPSSEED